MVTLRSAKPTCAGSIPARTSNNNYNMIEFYGRNVLIEAIISKPKLIGVVYLTYESHKFLKDYFVQKGGEALQAFNSLKTKVEDIRALDQMCGQKGARHQGVVFELDIDRIYKNFETLKHDLKNNFNDTEGGKSKAIVILNDLNDVQNVGAIIRSSAAFGAVGVVMGEYGEAHVTPAVAKASAGNIFKTNIYKIPNINNAIRILKDAHYWVYGLEGSGDTSLHEVQFDTNCAIVVGSEGTGLKEETLKNCDFELSIPIAPNCESLNASNAVAVALYEFSKQNKL